jgi:opacity protein-like surface antigen
MSLKVGRTVRVIARICALLASAAILTAVSQVNMAVAGIGGIGGGGGGRAHASLDGGTSDASGVHVAALSIIHLQDAIQNGRSEAEIRAMADDAGYRLVIT